MTGFTNEMEKEQETIQPIAEAKSPERIDKKYVSAQIQNVLTLDKGFFYTTKELFIRPGRTLRTYLQENRDRHIKPFPFLIFTSIIFTLVTYFFGITYSYLNVSNITFLQDKVSTGALGEWLNSNIGYTNLILGFFFAFWIKIFFRSSGYNVFEILVVFCFVLGEAIVIQALVLTLSNFLFSSLFALLSFMVILFYPVWAVGQFFGERKILNYIKTWVALMLGAFSYLLFFTLIGYVYKSVLNVALIDSIL